MVSRFMEYLVHVPSSRFPTKKGRDVGAISRARRNWVKKWEPRLLGSVEVRDNVTEDIDDLDAEKPEVSRTYGDTRVEALREELAVVYFCI